MEGHDYEYVVAAYLKNKGYHAVKVTQASGDYGVDVIAQKKQKKYAVQCKYYSSPVGLGAVQEAVAGKAMYGCNAAMVVTNSTFTKAAEELAEQNGVVLIAGVTSSGSTLKKKLIHIYIAALVLIAIGGVLSAIEQAKAGNYESAFSDVSLLLFILLFGLVLPIGIKKLCKYLCGRIKNKAKKETPPIQQPTVQTQPKTNAVNIPEGFEKYRNLTTQKQPAVEYDLKVTAKSRDEMIQQLLKLRNDDFDLYSHLYEIMKPAFEKGYISIGFLQRQMKIGFNRAARIMDALESVGFVLIKQEHNYTILVTEQEIIDMLAEIESTLV